MIQRSTEWLDARLGHLTASRMNDAFDLLAKGGEGQKRKNYRLELIAERLTGQRADFFESYAMRFGTEQEPSARSAYEAETGDLVQEVGFIKHPWIDWAGASPDGLVDDGLIEIKCPTSTTHITYLLEDKVPDQYKNQMMWQMLCTGREWCDFVSFDPRMPEGLQLMIKRFHPTVDELKDCEIKAMTFLNTVQEMMLKIEEYGIEKHIAEQA